MKKTPTNLQNSASLGAVLGALIGDAAGGTLEFLGHKPSDAEVANAMRLPGGGVFQLAPGQFTDDGEMTVTLLRTLNASGGAYEPDLVATAYCDWANSSPFDIGNATSQALRTPHDHKVSCQSIQAQAAAVNSDSKANGCLMRATPLGLLGASLSPEKTIQTAHLDASLTHPNKACLAATAAYALGIRHLILHPGDSGGAIDSVSAYLAQDNAEVSGWLDDAEAGRLPAAEPLIGFVRIAFTHAFYHLRQGTSFEQALASTLCLGGDTDTNACIVGGLVGASLGYGFLPEKMVGRVVNCDSSQGQHRPLKYSSIDVRSDIETLAKHIFESPTQRRQPCQ
jgi:ADP-ribosyl-[dinitrogen reductase] hydrolase